MKILMTICLLGLFALTVSEAKAGKQRNKEKLREEPQQKKTELEDILGKYKCKENEKKNTLYDGFVIHTKQKYKCKTGTYPDEISIVECDDKCTNPATNKTLEPEYEAFPIIENTTISSTYDDIVHTHIVRITVGCICKKKQITSDENLLPKKRKNQKGKRGNRHNKKKGKGKKERGRRRGNMGKNKKRRKD